MCICLCGEYVTSARQRDQLRRNFRSVTSLRGVLQRYSKVLAFTSHHIRHPRCLRGDNDATNSNEISAYSCASQEVRCEITEGVKLIAADGGNLFSQVC
jgi:hypothetical protein